MKSVVLNVGRHFLFNALNNAISLCRQSPKEAAQLLTALSECLIYQTEKTTCDIQEEVEFIESYLEVQKFRFEDRLTVTFDIDESIVMQVTPLTLLTFVENGFDHVLGKKNKTLDITIKLERKEGQPILTIEDDGGLMTHKQLEFILSSEKKTSLSKLIPSLEAVGRQINYKITPDVSTSVIIK